MAGHCPHNLHADICCIDCFCFGMMEFDPVSTSHFGGGLKRFSSKTGDPVLQARFEGHCCECVLHGKFNEVAQRCQIQDCAGVMVIQIDHMPLERERIGRSALAKRRKDELDKRQNKHKAACRATERQCARWTWDASSAIFAGSRARSTETHGIWTNRA